MGGGQRRASRRWAWTTATRASRRHRLVCSDEHVVSPRSSPARCASETGCGVLQAHVDPTVAMQERCTWWTATGTGALARRHARLVGPHTLSVPGTPAAAGVRRLERVCVTGRRAAARGQQRLQRPLEVRVDGGAEDLGGARVRHRRSMSRKPSTERASAITSAVAASRLSDSTSSAISVAARQWGLLPQGVAGGGRGCALRSVASWRWTSRSATPRNIESDCRRRHPSFRSIPNVGAGPIGVGDGAWRG